MANYYNQMAALCRFPLESLQDYMVNCLGYNRSDLENWPEKAMLIDKIIFSFKTLDAFNYLEPLSKMKLQESLLRDGKYILIKPGNSGAYNIAVLENLHVLPEEKVNSYANLFTTSPELLSALKELLEYTKNVTKKNDLPEVEILRYAGKVINKAEGK